MRVLDDTGAVTAEYFYDAWGNVTTVTDPDGSGYSNPFRYRGYYYDVESNLYYLQSRYYDPAVGRFLNADAVDYLGASGTVLGYNLYAYCENNAVKNYDPLGRYSIDSWKVASTIDLLLVFSSPWIQSSLFATSISFKSILKVASLVFNKNISVYLMRTIVPSVKYLAGAGFTLIRKAIWRLTGVTIYYFQDYALGKFFDKYTKKNKVWYFLSMLSSYGTFIAQLLDEMTDGRDDDKIKLW